MSGSYSQDVSLPNHPLWQGTKRIPYSFDIEVTARCNNNCTHCYINLPAGDCTARTKELSLTEVSSIVDQAAELGALWCLITGGEPLLRPDFIDIYKMVKKKGLLVSVFTNACLITSEHIELFKKYPPRDIEVTVYGATEEIYERISRRKGSYSAFRHGLDLLLSSGVKVRLKAMAIRSNMEELQAIARFCRQYTADFFRFDPLLNLRYDADPDRNAEICAERLTSEEIVAIEQADEERKVQMEKHCASLIIPEMDHVCDHLFHCGAGKDSFSISYDGKFRLCSSLQHEDALYDLRNGSLAEAWNEFVPHVLDTRSNDPIFLSGCRACPIVNLCLWCPATSYLESGKMDAWNEYFCQVAHARAEALRKGLHESHSNATG